MWGLIVVIQLCSIASVTFCKHVLDQHGGAACFTIAGVQLLLKWGMLEGLCYCGCMEGLKARRRDMLARLRGTVGLTGILAVSLSYAASYAAGLVSLQANSLLFDQLAKVGTVPATLLLQSLFRGDPHPPFAWLALAATLCGCMQFFNADVHASTYGLATLFVGFVVRSTYDVWASDRDYDLFPVTVMACLGPIAAVHILLVALVFDADGWALMLDPGMFSAVVLSAGANLAAHIGMTVIIDQTAPHVPIFFCVFKLLLFVASEFMLFGNEINARQSMGTLLLMVGLMATLEPHLAHWLLLVGTTYVTVFATEPFVSPFHFV